MTPGFEGSAALIWTFHTDALLHFIPSTTRIVPTNRFCHRYRFTHFMETFQLLFSFTVQLYSTADRPHLNPEKKLFETRWAS